MDKETLNIILRKFVDYDTQRFEKPFSQNLKIGKHICATDGKKLILYPDKGENFIDEVEGIKPPNIDGILPDFYPIDLDFDNLKKLYGDVPTIERNVREECESCDGDGSFKHYGHTYYCKSCNESGVIETSFIEKIKSPDFVFKFQNSLVEIEKISALMEVYGLLKKESVKFELLCSMPSSAWLRMDEFIFAFFAIQQEYAEKSKTINVI